VRSVLVARANEWLRQNAHLRAKTCESIEVKGRYDGVVDSNKSCYYEADHSKRRMRNLYIRAIRLTANTCCVTGCLHVPIVGPTGQSDDQSR